MVGISKAELDLPESNSMQIYTGICSGVAGSITIDYYTDYQMIFTGPTSFHTVVI